MNTTVKITKSGSIARRSGRKALPEGTQKQNLCFRLDPATIKIFYERVGGRNRSAFIEKVLLEAFEKEDDRDGVVSKFL